MNYDHDTMLIRTAGIVETARKNAGITQRELADSVGVIQSTISRIEKGVLAPTLFHWLGMCRVLNIPEDAISIGHFDRATTTRINSEAREGGYILPLAYRPLKCMKVRNFLPIFNFVREEYGEELLETILNDLKLKPTFFLNLDNQINMRFTDDFVNALGKYHPVDRRTQGRMVAYAASDKSHGVLSRLYKNAADQLDLIDRYLNNITKYHRVFSVDDYNFENGNISFKAQFHPEIQKVFDQMGDHRDDFLWDFYLNYLRKFSLFDFKNKYQKLKEVHIQSTPRNEQGIRQVKISAA